MKGCFFMKVKLYLLSAILFFLSLSIDVQANTNFIDHDTPSADFIDISSWQGYISVEEFKKIKESGISGVVVKVTEGISYINPFAYNQIRNAKKADLKVSGYHFSRYKNHDEAVAEASFFFESALKSGLEKTDVFVNDAEHTDLIRSSKQMTSEALTFKNRLMLLGIKTTDIYISESWKNQLIDLNIIGDRGWIASYPSIPNLSQGWHSTNNAWQWSDKFQFSFLPGIYFDINQDYSGIYTYLKNQTENSKYYIVQLDDSLYEIGNKINVPWKLIAQENSISSPYLIYPKQKLLIPFYSHFYVVQQNDSLYRIAQKTGVGIHSLLEMNPEITNKDLIYPYQKIIIK